MKKFIYFFLVLSAVVSCSKPADCIKSTGVLTTKNFNNQSFDRILIFKGISLIVKQGLTYEVAVKTGQNLIDDIEVTFDNNQLILKDNTTCKWIRDYGETTVTVTTPNLIEIYSKTEQKIISSGVLTFPNLKLVALDNFDGLGGSGVGDFELNINNQSLTIAGNNVANFYLTGQTNLFNIEIYEGNGKVLAQNFIAQNVQIYHRGSNSVYVHPVSSIKGNLFNIGNVYSNPKPPIVQVVEHFRGKIIF